MKAYLFLTALAVGLCALLVGAPVVSADGGGIIVTTNAPVPLIIDGIQTDKLPVSIGTNSVVTVVETLHYVTEQERWVFQKWSHGPTDTSVTLSQSGVYQAIYTHEVLVQLSSAVTNLQKSMWAPVGIPLKVEVPESVEISKNIRYRFSSWSGGETPYQAKNTIAPLKPTVLEAKWVKEYLFTIEAPVDISLPGSGWYADGSSLVLQAPDAVYGQNKNERSKFASWENLGFPVLVIPSPTNPIITIKMDAPYTVKANYGTQYLVVARTPFGILKRDWIKEGEEVVLDASPIVEIVANQEQFVFKRWEGMAGLVSPKVSGVINQPVELTAVYEHQVMLTVTAPYGAAGGGWYSVGSMATISVPSSESAFIMKKKFVGFGGYGNKRTIQVLAQAPMTITALYRTGVDFGVLFFLMLLPLGVFVIYILVQHRELLPRGVAFISALVRRRRIN